MNAAACDVADHDLVDVDPAAEITIDDEFAALIPPLAADERTELEASLVEHGGARDALIVWDRGDDAPPTLLDGHNRLEICRRLGLAYAVKGIRFANREQALNWMERNQLGRRNLSRQDFAIVLGRLYNRTKRPMGGRPRKEGKTPERTRERFAKEFGVDPRTVDRAGTFQAAAEKLGIEKEIASGRLRVSAPQVVAAAKSLRANPTRGEVSDALRRSKGAKDKRNHPDQKRRREARSWLVPAEPDDCLKAIDFYARSFMQRSPDSIDALTNLLVKIIEENKVPRAGKDSTR